MASTRRAVKKPVFFEKWGGFGKFQTGMSYPIEYLLTTFSVAELGHLTFAQDLTPTEPDFELLMQRDIDVDRVDKQMIRYLSPGKTEAEVRTQPTFFPPLLAAVVPVKGQEMVSYLPGEVVCRADIQAAGDGVMRSWGKILRLSYYEDSESATQYLLSEGTDTEPAGTSVGAECTNVRIEIKEAERFGAEDGIRLVVIDGQHRLSAILKLAARDRDSQFLSNLTVPICLVLAPNSTEPKARENAGLTLTVPRVFRSLFVDVNKNAVAVGGHFNSLLSDSDVGKLAVRLFCEQTLLTYQKPGLALVEWNIRAAKDASQIKRKYSMTSIGVIELALAKAIGNKPRHRGLMKRVLSLGLIEPQLYPEDVDYEYPKPIEWDRFSPGQKPILESQITEELVKNGLLRIFFEPEEFKAIHAQFSSVVDEYRSVVERKGDNFEAMGAVLQQVLDYKPISGTNHSLQDELKRFGDKVEGRYEAHTNPIIRYSIFQRAMIHAWLELIDFLRARDDLSVAQITTAFVDLLNFLLKRDRAIFSERSRRYLIHTAFKSAGVIKAAEATRLSLTALILSGLGNRRVLASFVKCLDLPASDRLTNELFDFGVNRATIFATSYQTQRRDEFIASWITDFSLPQDDRDELQSLQEQHLQLRKSLREKLATKEQALAAEDAFLACVSRHVGTDVELALKDLRDALGYDVDIILDNTLDGVEAEE